MNKITITASLKGHTTEQDELGIITLLENAMEKLPGKWEFHYSSNYGWSRFELDNSEDNISQDQEIKQVLTTKDLSFGEGETREEGEEITKKSRGNDGREQNIFGISPKFISARQYKDSRCNVPRNDQNEEPSGNQSRDRSLTCHEELRTPRNSRNDEEPNCMDDSVDKRTPTQSFFNFSSNQERGPLKCDCSCEKCNNICIDRCIGCRSDIVEDYFDFLQLERDYEDMARDLGYHWDEIDNKKKLINDITFTNISKKKRVVMEEEDVKPNQQHHAETYY